ncbi:hypothetical protein [Microbulbifer thermotolerans]|uniref:hypothetical protein n=1 Tax=Microbulbifer thermotolerans TaxID=252514 RepID=UPI00224A54C4|nr:hypothetical protein [Microbulbifer thermotolerans]MCX2834644.1 hypothetical protein [Microbulbifer thermotolerans]
MAKEVDRKLLAYIKPEGSEEVFIDIVEISRRSTSFHYKGIVWNRSPLVMGAGNCTDPHGNKCKIFPLNRHYTPSWAVDAKVIIKESAKERYNLWLSREIKSE